MEREKKVEISSLMRPALREAYQAVIKIFEENEFIPVKKIVHFPNGKVRMVEFEGLTREMVDRTSEAAWNVKIERDKKNLDKQQDVLGLAYCVVPQNSLSNSGYLILG